MNSLRLLILLPLIFWHSAGYAEASGVLAQMEDPDASAMTDDGDEEFTDEFDDEFEDEFDADGPPPVSDPLETMNRGFFWFNDKLYFYVLKPAAKAFRVLPEDVRASIANFFNHWTSPARFVNALLQAKINDAGNELGRFAINTTLGVGGLFDAAKEQAGLRRKDEDFGQTLGVYGFKPGMYLVIPVFGPSNVRDGIGRLVDGVMDPKYIYLDEKPYWGSRAVEAVNEISLDKDTYEAIKRDALDPYLFVRDAYMQNRAGKVAK